MATLPLFTLPTFPPFPNVVRSGDPLRIQFPCAAIGDTIPLVYGRQRLGGKLFFLQIVTGSFPELVLGVAWCLGPINRIVNLWLDEIPIVTDGVTQPGYFVHNYLGDLAQTPDSYLVGADPDYEDSLVIATGQGYLPVSYTTIKWPLDELDRFPELVAEVEGRLLFDPRDFGSTAYSTNPALMLGDFLSNFHYGLSKLPDEASLAYLADFNEGKAAYTRDDITYSWRKAEIGITLDSPVSSSEFVDALRAYAWAFIYEHAGKVFFTPDRIVPDLSSTDLLTEDDLLEGSLDISRSTGYTSPTVVNLTYTDRSTTPWSTQVATAIDGSVSGVGGVWLEDSVSMTGFSNAQQASREAHLRLRRLRLSELVISWGMFDDGLKYVPGSVVRIQTSLLGTIPVRITSCVSEEIGRWQFIGNLYSDELYLPAFSNTTGSKHIRLPEISDIPEPIITLVDSGESQLIVGKDGTVHSSIYLEWTVPDSYPYTTTGEVQYIRADRPTPPNPPKTTGLRSATCSPVVDGVEYLVILRLKNAFGKLGPIYPFMHIVSGKTAPPPPPTDFSVYTLGDGTRKYTWKEPAEKPLDFAGYQIRYRFGSGYTWEEMAPLHTGLLSASPYESGFLPKGEHSFAVVSVDTSGNLSEPNYYTTTLLDPRAFFNLILDQPHTELWSRGTLTNCWVSPEGWLLAKSTKTWADFATDGVKWSGWTKWSQATSTMTYEHPVIDLGLKLQFALLLSCVVVEGTPTLEYATSDDNTNWSAWSSNQAVSLFTRYIKTRVSVAGSTGLSPGLKEVEIRVTGQPVEEYLVDVDTSTMTGPYRIGVGDIRIPLSKTYKAVYNAIVSLQNVGPGWSWELIDKQTTYGPRIRIYNSSGNLADAIIDVLVRGI